MGKTKWDSDFPGESKTKFAPFVELSFLPLQMNSSTYVLNCSQVRVYGLFLHLRVTSKCPRCGTFYTFKCELDSSGAPLHHANEVTFCQTPNVTHNSSNLPHGTLPATFNSLVEDTFRAVDTVEFVVKVSDLVTLDPPFWSFHFVSSEVGPFEDDHRKCKLTCTQGHWVGPLCKDTEEGDYEVLSKRCRLNFQPPMLVLTYKYRELKVL